MIFYLQRQKVKQGEGEQLSRDYFRLVEQILQSRELSGREVSRRIGQTESYFSRIKTRGKIEKSWRVLEEGLGISPRNVFAVLADDVQYDEILAAFGPQDSPQQPKHVSRFAVLEELVLASPGCHRGDVSGETWTALEELERRRFKEASRIETECKAIVGDLLSQRNLQLDQAALAVGAIGVWSTIRRHANDRGSATQGLIIAIRAATTLGVDKLHARLLQRACYLLGDVENYEASEMAARKAVELYSDIQDLEGLGMALIDTGMAAYGGGDWNKAKSRLLLGAGLLGSSSLNHINKASAFHFAARTCAIRGDLAEASLYLEQAARFAGSHEGHWAAIRWCAGTIQFQLGDYESAESALQEALKVYLRADKVTDIVMILLDLAMVLVAQDRVKEIPPLATHLLPYLDRLSEKDQVRRYVEEAHACLSRARHVQALQRFRKSYEAARRKGFTAP